MTAVAYRVVPLEAVRPNSWNYNVQGDHQFEKMVESMRRFGFVAPIVVRRVGDTLEIVNGEHRWHAARLLGLVEISIVDLGELAELDAKQLTVILNELGGDADQARLADLLRGISADIGRDALAQVMPFTESELDLLVDATTFLSEQLPRKDMRAVGASKATRAKPVAKVEQTQQPAPPQLLIVQFDSAASVEELQRKMRTIADTPHAAIDRALEHYLTCKGAK